MPVHCLLTIVATPLTCRPHVGRARIVAPGSKVHESVRDKMAIVSRTGKKYVPKAELPEDIKWVS